MGFNKMLVIAVLLVSLTFAVFSGIILAAGSYYAVPVDPEYQEIFNKYEETKTVYEGTQEILDGGDINPEGQDQAIYKNVIAAGKQTQQSGKLFLVFAMEVPKIMGIRADVLAMIVSLVFILAIFGFLTMISKEAP